MRAIFECARAHAATLFLGEHHVERVDVRLDRDSKLGHGGGETRGDLVVVGRLAIVQIAEERGGVGEEC